MCDNRLTRDERLRGEIRVNNLFLSGESFIAYPYRVVYTVSEAARPAPTALLVSIPKKRFKRAVKRNRARRRIREAYRIHEDRFLPGYDLVVVARVRAGHSRYREVERSLLSLADKLGLLRKEEA